MMPLLTKPTTITVVALELWITAAVTLNRKKALERVVSQFAQDLCSWPLGLLSSALPMMSIPNRNKARPPLGKYIKNSHLKFLALFDTFI